MANSFLDRNKKKPSSSLLVLLGFKRGIGPLALLLVFVMGVFIAPANFTSGVIDSLDQKGWGRPLARMLRAATGTPQAAGYGDIVSQLRAARQQTNKTAWSLFSRGAGSSNADSLGMVRGGEQDVLGAASIASKIQGGKTINGVLSPADSRKQGRGGVELTNEDLQGGFVASASANVFQGQNLLTGGRVAPASEDTTGEAALKASGRVPGADRMVAGREGKLSKTQFQGVRMNETAFGNVHHSNVGLPGSALYMLADARTRAMMSRDPACSKDNGCPAEYSHVNTGAVYDGNHVGKKAGSIIESAPPVYGVTGSNAPGLVTFDGTLAPADDLEKVKSDQRACDEADATYKPLLNPHVQRMTELGLKAPTTQNQNEMRRECHIVDDLLRQQYMACPLRHEDGPYEPQQCD